MSKGSTEPDVAFYTVADSRYFPGLAALVNSLRVVGHGETVYVLDCGLDSSQRALLAPEATLVTVEGGGAPALHKYVVPLERPSDVMVLIDADVILTRPIREVIDAAADGRVVAFPDRLTHRFFPEWGELLGLDGLVPRTYLNAGFIVLPREPGMSVLERAQAGLARIEVDRSVLAGGPRSYPFYYLDQDVLNPVLAALVEPDGVLTLDSRLAPPPPFEGLRIVDAPRLRCTYADGVEPFALHHLEEKPWLAATTTNPYSRLLSRLLLDPTAAVPVKDGLPLRLHDGALAACARKWSDGRAAYRVTWRKVRYRARLVRTWSRPESSVAARGETR